MAGNNFMYLYDSSFDGLMTCVFEAFACKENPIDISYETNILLPYKFIETDAKKSERVKRSIKARLGAETYRIIYLVYLSREKGNELNILAFLRFMFSHKGATLHYLDNPIVSKMFFIAKSVSREHHHIIEFIRFSDYNGNLIAVINPKYFVLPLIAHHFENRFNNENFLIFDEIHLAGLIHIEKNTKIIPIEDFTIPKPNEEEKKIQNLWKLFYDTIEIKQRRNLALRRTHFPKRFWKNITELKEEISE